MSVHKAFIAKLLENVTVKDKRPHGCDGCGADVDSLLTRVEVEERAHKLGMTKEVEAYTPRRYSVFAWVCSDCSVLFSHSVS